MTKKKKKNQSEDSESDLDAEDPDPDLDAEDLFFPLSPVFHGQLTHILNAYPTRFIPNYECTKYN